MRIVRAHRLSFQVVRGPCRYLPPVFAVDVVQVPGESSVGLHLAVAGADVACFVLLLLAALWLFLASMLLLLLRCWFGFFLGG